MKKLISLLLWRLNLDLAILHTADALREMAVLWLVFAMLDKLVQNDLTLRWIAANVSAAVVMWCVGLYAETFADRRRV